MTIFTVTDMVKALIYAQEIADRSNIGAVDLESYSTRSGRGIIIRVHDFKGTPFEEYYTGTAESLDELKDRINVHFARLIKLANAH